MKNPFSKLLFIPGCMDGWGNFSRSLFGWIQGLLKITYIAGYGVTLLLNLNFVDTIAEKMIRIKHPTIRNYITPNMEIWLSLTSLTGNPAINKFDDDRPEMDNIRKYVIYGRFAPNQGVWLHEKIHYIRSFLKLVRADWLESRYHSLR